MLREHIERFDVAPDGRVFRNAAGNYIDYYAKFLAEARHHANRLIEDSMQRWDECEDAPAGA
ncbi:hypothetical protein [Streptomyces sp. NEAU-L66]|uniref:hypothetical protein n=1 Tax=Streptomyces sp. NEAU-L66 TaxID=3390812 RepID=UPI0039C698CD